MEIDIVKVREEIVINTATDTDTFYAFKYTGDLGNYKLFSDIERVNGGATVSYAGEIYADTGWDGCLKKKNELEI